MIPRLIWTLQRWRRAVSWPLLAGFAALAGCAAYYAIDLLPLQAKINEGQTRLAALTAAREAQGEVRRALSPAEQLESFYAFFPESTVVPEVLEKLFTSAAKENLAVPQGEYRQAREVSGRLTRYELILPLKGPYPGLRRFIAEALRETPALALQGVSFNRQAANEIGVDAQVRFTLYVRTEVAQ